MTLKYIVIGSIFQNVILCGQDLLCPFMVRILMLCKLKYAEFISVAPIKAILPTLGMGTTEVQFLVQKLNVYRLIAALILFESLQDNFCLNLYPAFQIQISLKPHRTGEIHVLGISYTLTMVHITTDPDVSNIVAPSVANGISINGVQMFSIRGPRLNKSKKEQCSRIYGPDRRLEIKVIGNMPLLQVS